MTIERAIQILDPEHREHYDSIETVNEACRMGMAALRAQQEAGENESLTWISVKDRLPKYEDDVLVRVMETETYGRHRERKQTYNWFYVGYYDGETWYTVYCHGCERLQKINEFDPNCYHEVTHWMPLPEPPTED